eukprot:Protomagalhaensia_sp_Gyna_25__4727@NODE_462_length_3372_cov_173_184218_g357_i0_p3_GENE_NODE_462_length_3372_cov_173_184218_g357_i0NODE_462_length_3372_cov_173_184218_g357_i0_p3_ORF_typecomplete_len240_score25_56Nas2_N/PF18265_1/2_1e24GRASP55_65/PF04495_14/7_4e07PDZ_6/PF17820_1/0_00025PDZ_2/PF13180_6/1_1e03PDZ_2/PF13180_6/0_02_NODE_462_length_3372_cov_173_184218_g357_i012591978
MSLHEPLYLYSVTFSVGSNGSLTDTYSKKPVSLSQQKFSAMAASPSMAALLKERDRIETRAQELTAYLTGPGMPGLKGGLDDADGYPRADIDIIGIVNARHELACLNTDYSDLMKDIEKELHQIHQERSVAVPRPETGSLQPFGKVGSLAAASPGFMAGLEEGDLLLRFGALDLKTAPLQSIFEQLPRLVKNNQNKEITVVVKRGETVSTRILRPRVWDGAGLLGFRLEPVSPPPAMPE